MFTRVKQISLETGILQKIGADRLELENGIYLLLDFLHSRL